MQPRKNEGRKVRWLYSSNSAVTLAIPHQFRQTSHFPAKQQKINFIFHNWANKSQLISKENE